MGNFGRWREDLFISLQAKQGMVEYFMGYLSGMDENEEYMPPIPLPTFWLSEFDWIEANKGFPKKTFPYPDELTPSSIIWKNRTPNGLLETEHPGQTVTNRLVLGIVQDPEPYRELTSINWQTYSDFTFIHCGHPPDIVTEDRLLWYNRRFGDSVINDDLLVIHKSVLGIK